MSEARILFDQGPRLSDGCTESSECVNSVPILLQARGGLKGENVAALYGRVNHRYVE